MTLSAPINYLQFKLSLKFFEKSKNSMPPFFFSRRQSCSVSGTQRLIFQEVFGTEEVVSLPEFYILSRTEFHFQYPIYLKNKTWQFLFLLPILRHSISLPFSKRKKKVQLKYTDHCSLPFSIQIANVYLVLTILWQQNLNKSYYRSTASQRVQDETLVRTKEGLTGNMPLWVLSAVWHCTHARALD